MHGVPRATIITPLYKSAAERIGSECQAHAKRGNLVCANNIPL
jgi:hypothetical protein